MPRLNDGAADARLDPARPRTDAEIAREICAEIFGCAEDDVNSGAREFKSCLRGVAAGRAEERKRFAVMFKHPLCRDEQCIFGRPDKPLTSSGCLCPVALREVDDE